MVTLYTIDDSSVNSSNPDTNYNNVGYDLNVTGTNWASFLKFDLSGENNTLLSASLYLYNLNIGIGTTTCKRVTSGDWVEGTITWNNQPAVTTTNAASFTDQSGWCVCNVTDMIIDMINGNNYGLRIYERTGISGSSPKFEERESAGTNDAYLVISYTALDKYVDISTGSDSNSGDTWANAYLTVKKGIDNLLTNNNLHIAFGDYSAQTAIDLNQNINLICENYGGGGTGTVTLPPTT